MAQDHSGYIRAGLTCPHCGSEVLISGHTGTPYTDDNGVICVGVELFCENEKCKWNPLQTTEFDPKLKVYDPDAPKPTHELYMDGFCVFTGSKSQCQIEMDARIDNRMYDRQTYYSIKPIERVLKKQDGKKSPFDHLAGNVVF